MEVKKEFENKLLKRKELDLFFEGGAALKRDDVKSQVVKKFKADEKLVVVNKMSTSYGQRDLMAIVYIYEDEKIMSKLTLEHISKRNATKAEEASEEA